MKRSIVQLFIAMLFAGPVYASDSNLYLGVGFGQVDYEGEKVRNIAFEPGQRLEDSAGYAEVYLGFRVNDYLNLELGYADFAEVEETYRLDPDIVFIVSPNYTEEVDAKRYSLSTLLQYPASDRFKLYLLLGFAYFDVDRTLSGGFSPVSGGLRESSSDYESGLLYGVGARFALNDRFSLRVQWADANTDKVDAQTLGIALEINY